MRYSTEKGDHPELKKNANIVAWDNGAGLSRDIDVLVAELNGFGWSVTINGKRRRARHGASFALALERVRYRIRTLAVATGLTGPLFDLNLHLEDIRGQCLGLARWNVLIPNQEWFRDGSRPHLAKIDEVWAKTRVAERVFADLGCKVRFLGWTGVDRRAGAVHHGTGVSALHVAGASSSKGTEALLDVWSAHPHWPVLRVLRRWRGGHCDDRQLRQSRPQGTNIRITEGWVEESALLQMQNECAICVCPSEVEGFGHNIVEAMSLGVLVITTDAPPMNEIVTRETGLLVTVDRSEPMRLGRRYFVDRADLARQIGVALAMSEEQRKALGDAARSRFEQNDAAFRANLREYMELMAGGASTEAESSGAAPSPITQTSVE